jgi:hypothetical protein
VTGLLVVVATLAAPFIAHWLAEPGPNGAGRRAVLAISYALLAGALVACVIAYHARGPTSGVKILVALWVGGFGSTCVLVGRTAPHWRRRKDDPRESAIFANWVTANVCVPLLVCLLAGYHVGALETSATGVSRAMSRTFAFVGFYALDPPFEVKRVEVGSCVLDDGVGWPDFSRAQVVRCSETHRWQVELKVDEKDPCPEADAYDTDVRAVERVIPPNKWCLVEAVSGQLTHPVCFIADALACTE